MSRGTPCVYGHRATKYRIQVPRLRALLSLSLHFQFCSPVLALISSRPSSLEEPPVVPSLCSYQHKSFSIERAFGHDSLKKSIELSLLRWAWATRPSLIQSKQSSDPEWPRPGHITMPRAQGRERAHPRTHHLGGERKEGHRYFPKAILDKVSPGTLHWLSSAL